MLEDAKLGVTSALKLPKDVMLGEMLVSLVGRHCAVIENYRSILLYSDAQLKLQGKTSRLVISGSRLVIEYYTSEEMKVSGLIQSVTFET